MPNCDIYHAPLLGGNLEFKMAWIQSCMSGTNLNNLLLGIIVLCVLLLIGIIYVSRHDGEIYTDTDS